MKVRADLSFNKGKQINSKKLEAISNAQDQEFELESIVNPYVSKNRPIIRKSQNA